MRRAKMLTPEVFAAESAVMTVAREQVEELQRNAGTTPRRTSRILMHRYTDAKLHEMIIVHSKGRYIRPHKNAASSKSYHVIAGELACLLFSEEGVVTETHMLGDCMSGRPFLLRLDEPRYHTLVCLSDTVVFVETILGPFQGTPYAPWAPEEGDVAAAAYFESLRKHLPSADPILVLQNQQ